MNHKPKKNIYQLAKRSRFDTALLPAISNLVALGLSEADIGVILGYAGSDPREWLKGLKKRHQDVREACEIGKQMARITLVARMFQAAIGYDYEESETTYVLSDKDGNKLKKPIPITRKIKQKHCKPNSEMMKRLLGRCCPSEFSEDTEPSTDEGGDTSGFLEKYTKKVDSQVVGGS